MTRLFDSLSSFDSAISYLEKIDQIKRFLDIQQSNLFIGKFWNTDILIGTTFKKYIISIWDQNNKIRPQSFLEYYFRRKKLISFQTTVLFRHQTFAMESFLLEKSLGTAEVQKTRNNFSFLFWRSQQLRFVVLIFYFVSMLSFAPSTQQFNAIF
jgi:hypothetical protein